MKLIKSILKWIKRRPFIQAEQHITVCAIPTHRPYRRLVKLATWFTSKYDFDRYTVTINANAAALLAADNGMKVHEFSLWMLDTYQMGVELSSQPDPVVDEFRLTFRGWK